MKIIKVKRGEILQHTGDLNSKIYFIESGLLRSFTIDEKGKEHIYMFAPENWTIADSVLPSEPNELYIDALEDSVIKVYDKTLGSNGFNKEAVRKRLAVLQKRIIMLMSYSAIKRYDSFIETYPAIVQRVPQRMIASFLGITPEALSKIKKKHTS